jgi:hypothetical protein
MRFIHSRIELQDLFGEGQATKTYFGVGICYHFVDNEEIYFCPSLFRGLGVDNTYLITDPEMNVGLFLCWVGCDAYMSSGWLLSKER